MTVKSGQSNRQVRPCGGVIRALLTLAGAVANIVLAYRVSRATRR